LQSRPGRAVRCNAEHQPAIAGIGRSVDPSSSCDSGQGGGELTYLPGRLRLLRMVLQTWIVLDQRRLPSMGTERRASMWVICPSHRGLSSNCSQRGLHPVGILLSGGWTSALWTNVYEAYKRANGGAEPPNLVGISVRRLRRITNLKIWTRSTGTPGTI
jgi:hypothetical protein